ncbi:MAG TPA: glycine--tRNA ligase [Candidatus Micrarchaeia archaeon]|nr:glycine--tRNA ligase [Candidatus Micrarchaeia archaeon]
MSEETEPITAATGDGQGLVDKLTSLAKRRGFVFPSSEIYGGLNAVWDYGPLGVRLRRNVRESWWRRVVELRRDVEGIECAILMNPKVWVASGHVDAFTDPLVDCLGSCHRRWRQDQLGGDRCPDCGGELSAPRRFNLMFKTFVGPVEEETARVYLRPETAQGMFVNFKNVLQSSRQRLPFGIAQVGRSFRNEISPGNFIFRSREFEQMEMEWFCPPGEDEPWFHYWCEDQRQWFLALGIREANLRLRPHAPEELAHYALAATDIEYRFPFGWGELEGIARRGDYDLRRHQEVSGKDLTYLDPVSGEHRLAYVVEPAVGVDRTALTVLLDAYHEEEVQGERRVVLRLAATVAPYQVAVLPLSKNADLMGLARGLEADLRRRLATDYDETQSIGRRYRRQDEIGTPLCVTVDFDSLADRAATIRERDSMAQVRVGFDRLLEVCRAKLGLDEAAPGTGGPAPM